jgi:hypothetical protein
MIRSKSEGPNPSAQNQRFAGACRCCPRNGTPQEYMTAQKANGDILLRTTNPRDRFKQHRRARGRSRLWAGVAIPLRSKFYETTVPFAAPTATKRCRLTQSRFTPARLIPCYCTRAHGWARSIVVGCAPARAFARARAPCAQSRPTLNRAGRESGAGRQNEYDRRFCFEQRFRAAQHEIAREA